MGGRCPSPGGGDHPHEPHAERREKQADLVVQRRAAGDEGFEPPAEALADLRAYEQVQHRVEQAVPGPAPDVEEVPDPLEVQVPIIRDVLDAFGICVIGADGYEADDVIGSLASQARQAVDIVTGDRDLFQLVDDETDVRVLYIARGVGNHERVTNDWVRAKYAIDGHQYADFATMRGDASDGLPGVAGVGEKTAATLLARFGDMAGIIAAAADPGSDMGPGPRAKIKAAAGYLEVAPRVVAVARDLDLGRPDTRVPAEPRDLPRVAELGRKWGLESPVQRLTEVLCSG